MKFKTYLMLMLFGMSITFALAQNELDALRYSGTTSAGTARSQAMAGAFSAVGADFSAVYLNPAGLALFRKSELMMTPGLKFISTKSDYLGATETDASTNFGFSNLGYVYTSDINDKKVLKSYNMGFGFNQIANFNRSIDVTGFNPHNSISEKFAELAQGSSTASLTNGGSSYPALAYYAFMINPDPNGSFTDWVPAVPGGNINQRVQYEESGRNNEWSFALSGNLDDFIYIGAAVGIRDLKYSQTKRLFESDDNNLHTQTTGDSTAFNSLEYSDFFKTRGTGLNARFGIIIRPVDFIRIGMSVQTPTIYNLTDTYFAEVKGTFDGDPTEYMMPESQNQIGQFSYKLSTPFVFTTGVMAMIKKSGFISADFEISDYTGAKFSAESSPNSNSFTTFQDENDNIKEMFSFSYNYRLGGEYRLNALRFRAGFANYGSVLKKDYLEYYEYSSGELNKINGNRRLITGGLGFKQQSYYLDLAIINDVSQDRQLFYSLADPTQYDPELINKKTINSILLTIGFTF